MADWRTIDWSQLDTHSLILIMNAVWRALENRLIEHCPSQPPGLDSQRTTSAPDSSDSPTGSFSVVRGNEPTYRAGNTFGAGSETLLTPFRCDYHCQWCTQPCTRRAGHILIIHATAADIEDDDNGNGQKDCRLTGVY